MTRLRPGCPRPGPRAARSGRQSKKTLLRHCATAGRGWRQSRAALGEVTPETGAFGAWGSVAGCGASVRGGRRVQCPGPESGLGGQSWRKAPGPRTGALGPAWLRLVAAAGPLAMGSACCVAGAQARTPRRVTAYCGSSWGRPAVALIAFPRTRRWVLLPGPRCPSEPAPWRRGILLERPLWASSLQDLLPFSPRPSQWGYIPLKEELQAWGCMQKVRGFSRVFSDPLDWLEDQPATERHELLGCRNSLCIPNDQFVMGLSEFFAWNWMEWNSKPHRELSILV